MSRQTNCKTCYSDLLVSISEDNQVSFKCRKGHSKGKIPLTHCTFDLDNEGHLWYQEWSYEIVENKGDKRRWA
jgi:hypothetical protein